jgi:hypothetical protein
LARHRLRRRRAPRRAVLRLEGARLRRAEVTGRTPPRPDRRSAARPPTRACAGERPLRPGR